MAMPAGADAVLEAEKTTGVAPFAVLYDARRTTDRDVGDPFHDLVYTFEFGEKRANPSYDEVWGLDGDDFLRRLSKDRYVGGPLAGHVYEKPGRYVATVRARDPKGGETTATLTITVRDPNEVFSGNRTVCFRAGSGSFAGCPAGAEQRTSSDFGTITRVASENKRVLLRRGDQFRGSGTFEPSGDAILGAFGSGPRPIIRGVSGNETLQIGGRGARVVDIEFISPVTSSNGDGSRIIGSVSERDAVQESMLLRVKTQNGHAGIGLFGKPARHQLAMVDCEIGDVAPRTDGKEGGKNFDGRYTRSMLMGNLIGASPTSFNMRIFNLDTSVVSFNKYDGTNDRTSLRVQSSDNNEGSHDFIFSYNTYGRNAHESAEFNPASPSFYTKIFSYIVEGNFLPTGTDNIKVFGQNVSFRNNIKIVGGTGAGHVLGRVRRIELSKCDGQFCTQFPTKNLRLHNNTCYFTSSDASQPCIVVEDDVTAGRVDVTDNLLYAPNASGLRSVADGPAVKANNMLRQRGDSSPLVDDRPSSITDFERVPAVEAAEVGAAIDGLFTPGEVALRPAPPVILGVR